MNNNIQNNWGNQFFQENNYFSEKEVEYDIEDLINKPKKTCSLLKATVAGVISLVADLITILVGLSEMKKYGLIKFILEHVEKLYIYTILIAIFTLVAFYIFINLFQLLTKKAAGNFVLKNNVLYRFTLKKCPICGSERNGKIKIEYDESGNVVFKCNCDSTHKWIVPYHQIIKMVE